MKRSVLVIIIVLVVSLLMTGCSALDVFVDRVPGSGELIVEHRELPAFNSINASGDIQLFLTQLDKGVEVHAESNLLKYIRTYVEDQTLVIEIAKADGSSVIIEPFETIVVYVQFDRIKDISLAGGVEMTSSQLVAEGAEINLSLYEDCHASINALRTDILHVSLSGGSDLEIVDGQVLEQYIAASEDSTYTADWVKSDITEITLSDGSEATIWAEETFSVDISGGSIAYYYGSPVNLTEVRNRGDSDYISRGEH
jgi:hypothetical protein